jgi:hypothetical protein
MRNNLQGNPAMLKIIVLITCFMLVLLYNKTKAATPPSTFKKISLSFKQDKKELKVSLKTATSKTLSLYFFSKQGILVKEVSLSSLHESVITGMKKGTYWYRCFDNELEVNCGKLLLN